MNFSVHTIPVTDSAVLLRIDGELDLNTAPLLAATLATAAAAPMLHVVVAATGLRFCDLSGLRELVGASCALRARGGGLAVAEGGRALRRLIDLTASAPFAGGPWWPPLAVYTSVEEALRHYGGTRPPEVSRHPALRRLAPPALPRTSIVSTVPAPGPELRTVIERSRKLREQSSRQLTKLNEQLARALRTRELMGERLDTCLASRAALRDHLHLVRETP